MEHLYFLLKLSNIPKVELLQIPTAKEEGGQSLFDTSNTLLIRTDHRCQEAKPICLKHSALKGDSRLSQSPFFCSKSIESPAI